MPILTNKYWFATFYFLLVLVSPILDRIICLMEKNEYLIILGILMMIFSVIPSVNIFGDPFGTEYGYSFIWFVVLYLIAGYIRRYNMKKSKCRYAFIYGIGVLIIVLFKTICASRSGLLSILINLFISHYNSPLVIAMSVSVFIMALSVKVSITGTVRKVVSYCSGLSFGVYLFHEHPCIRNIIWNGNSALNNRNIGIKMFSSVVMIYIMGLGIEFIRNKTMIGIRIITKRMRSLK